MFICSVSIFFKLERTYLFVNKFTKYAIAINCNNAAILTTHDPLLFARVGLVHIYHHRSQPTCWPFPIG